MCVDAAVQSLHDQRLIFFDNSETKVDSRIIENEKTANISNPGDQVGLTTDVTMI